MSKLIRVTFFLILASSIISAQEIRTVAENYWIQTTTWDTSFTSSQLIESSLMASGLVEESINLFLNKYKQLLGKFENDRKASFSTLSEYEQGEYILNWAHNNILKNYIENQTLMDVLIDSGNYNCVSSAIFYLILAKEAGLNADIIETSDHAFCSVYTKEGIIDVETTTPYGFNPGLKKEFQQSFNQTGYTYVPPGNYRSRDQIKDREAVALILQNRMSSLQKDNKHKKVIGIAIDRWVLAENNKSHVDMNDAFRNWAAVLNNKGTYTEAYYFLSDVSLKYNLVSENSDLLFDLAYNQIITLTNNDNYNLANTFLEEIKLTLNSTDQTKLEKIVAKDYLSDIVRNESYEISLPLVREAQESGSISKSDWQNWITVLHQNEALKISNNAGWWDAWEFLKTLPLEEKNLNSIKTSIIRAHDNWSFGIHNQFADLFNSQEFKTAEKLLLEALSKDPGNRYLTKDLNDIKKVSP